MNNSSIRYLKPSVKAFYTDLTQRYKLKLWLDEYELGSASLNNEISKGNSKFIDIDKKYLNFL